MPPRAGVTALARSVLQPRDVSHLRHPGRLHRFRRARDRKGRAEVPQPRGDPIFWQPWRCFLRARYEARPWPLTVTPWSWRAIPTLSPFTRAVLKTVATLGMALTLRHIRILSRHASKRIVFVRTATRRTKEQLIALCSSLTTRIMPEARQERIEVCAVTLPDNLDPAEFVAAPRRRCSSPGLLDEAGCRFCSTASRRRLAATAR